MLKNPSLAANPFFNLAPKGWLLPLVGLSTIATIIASQAIISGAFSLTYQATQLGYLPRLKVVHTSDAERGQVYIPAINRLLLVLTILVVLMFRSSANLAVAYGIAITLTMLITDLLLFFIMRYHWRWSMSLLLAVAFLAMDGGFFASNSLKIEKGGWFPLLMGAAVFGIFQIWIQKSDQLKSKLRAGRTDLTQFVKKFNRDKFHPVPHTAIYLNEDNHHIPSALLHNLEHNQVIHEKIIFLKIAVSTKPRVLPAERMNYKELGKGFFRIEMNYGYMEKATLPVILAFWKSKGIIARMEKATCFLSKEHLGTIRTKGLTRLETSVFGWLQNIDQNDIYYYEIPTNMVFEIGKQVEIL